jgi:hypothetical protein
MTQQSLNTKDIFSFMNFVAQKQNTIETEIQTLTRLTRWHMWKQLLEDNKEKNHNPIANHGFRVYSQNDQDGIIEFLCNQIFPGQKPTFAEFGCDNGIENNTHYLLVKGHKGLWIDTVEEHVDFINKSFEDKIKSRSLTIQNNWINKDNINSVLGLWEDNNSKIDILVIDTDWNEYYLFEALKLTPAIIVIEYNAHIPPPTAVTVPYNDSESALWDGSNYFGTSLCALNSVARNNGYSLAGCSIAGTDVFFVRDDKIGLLNSKSLLPEDVYQPAIFNLEFNLGHSSNIEKWKNV